MHAQTHDIAIFDTTLRDGGQTPGCALTFNGRVAVAEALEKLGVSVIEAGFAIASPAIFKSIKTIATQNKNTRIAVLARAKEDDIDKAAQSIQKAIAGRIHTFIATSDIHMRDKLGKTPDEVLDIIDRSVRYARNKCGEVQWSAEDASRSNLHFLCRAAETAIRAGATIINLPDTVGYALPHQYKHMFEYVRQNTDGADKVVFSAHCHNDLGMAVANSLSALDGGARQIEGTINGIGERAGNVAIEEVVMALRVHEHTLPYRVPGIMAHEFTAVSKLVAQKTGLRIAANKAIVGPNAFAHESGIHQDGTTKNTSSYEIMAPESVGNVRRLPIGDQSGIAGIEEHVKTLGHNLNNEQLLALTATFKKTCSKKPRTDRTRLLKTCLTNLLNTAP